MTDKALADIEDIGAYIEQENPSRAATFVIEVRRRCATIGDNPLAAPLRPKWGRRVRGLVFRNYIVVYRDEADAVVILRVLHGARDIDRLMT